MSESKKKSPVLIRRRVIVSPGLPNNKEDCDEFERLVHELIHLLVQNFEKLKGNFLDKKSSYERIVCEILGLEYDSQKFWDCKHGNLYIELKKGRRIWIDLDTLSMVKVEYNENSKIKTVMLFLVPSMKNDKIGEIYLVVTDKLIKALNITSERAETVLETYEYFGKRTNNQYPLTLTQLREIADYKIYQA